MSYKELLERLAELGLEKLDPSRRALRAQKLKLKRQLKKAEVLALESESTVTTELETDSKATAKPKDLLSAQKVIQAQQVQNKQPSGRYIPAHVRHLVWLRDQGKCTLCGSKHRLQLDHITPFALGGKSTPENLRLLCQQHNSLMAVRSFGLKKVMRDITS